MTTKYPLTRLLATVIMLAAFSALAEELIINHNDGTGIIERCRFTLDNTAPVIIDSTTGDITAQVTDPDACGSTTPVPPTVTVTPATATINLGDSQTISWSSTGATSCAKSGAWGTGTVASSGSETVTPAATGQYTYTISCTNNDGTASDSSVVTVTDPNVPAFCSSIPTFGLTRQDPPSSFVGLTGTTWPGTLNEKAFFSINRNQYVALSFIAGTGSGQHSFEAGRPQEGPAAGYVVKISQCPGDLTHNIPFDADTFFCQKEGSAININWSNNSASGSCKLTPGVTYYLNIAHGSVSSDNTAYTNSCSSSTFCSALMQRTQ